MVRRAENIVAFYNKRGTCEQWIKEGKGAVRWTQLSCNQDWREDREPRPLRRLSDGRGRHSPANVPGDFAADRRTAAEAAARASMRWPMLIRSRATNGKAAPTRQGEVLRSNCRTPFQGRIARNRPRTKAGLPETSENNYNAPQVRGSSGECRIKKG